MDTEFEEGKLGTATSANTVDVRQLLGILSRRWLPILSVAAAVTALASLFAIKADPTYRSSMQLLIGSSLYQNARQSTVDEEFTDPNLQVDYTAQITIMNSPKLIEKAVERLRSTYPDLKAKDIKNSGDAPVLLEIEQLEAGSGTNRVPSQVFNISITADDPIKSQRILDTLRQIYLENNLEEQRERLAVGLAFIDEQLPQVRRQVSEAERNLEEFRQQNDLIDPETRALSLSTALVEIEQTQRDNRTELEAAQAAFQDLQRQLAESPQRAILSARLSQSTRYQALLNKIQETELALTQERLRFQDGSPFVQKLLSQRQEQLGLLQAEAENVLSDQARQLPAGTLQQQGQYSEIDLELVKNVIAAQARLVELTARRQGLSQSEAQVRQELSRYPGLVSEFNRLKPEIEINRKTLEQLLQAQQALGLRIAQGGFNWQVLVAPEPGSETGRSPLFSIAIGAVLGLILGTGVAVAWEILDDTLHGPDDLPRLTGLPLLGAVPRMRQVRGAGLLGRRGQPSPVETIAWASGQGALDLTFQGIQTIRSPLSAKPVKSLLISSALPQEGKTTLAIGLSMSAARMNQRVLLIDANLQRPRLHHMLNLSNEQGLSFLLSTDAGELAERVESFIQPWHLGIDVLTAGAIPEDSVRLLSSQRMKTLLEACSQRYDWVLIDAPPTLGSVDASVVASFCDVSLLVARIGVSTRSSVTQAVNLMSTLNVIGVVANEAKASIGGYRFVPQPSEASAPPTILTKLEQLRR